MDNFNIDKSYFGYVYRTTNLISGKSYIGKHRITKDEEWMSYLGSGRYITRAIRKHGKSSFYKELVCYAKNEKELAELETKTINEELRVKGKSGVYNILHAPSEALDSKNKSSLDSFPILSWYFDDLLTQQEIADRIGCSQPTVQSYLNLFRDSDERFSNVLRGVGPQGRRRKPVSDSTKEKIKIAKSASPTVRSKESYNYEKVKCSKCSRLIAKHFLDKHSNKCNGLGGFCEHCGLPVVNRRARWCGEHRYSSQRK